MWSPYLGLNSLISLLNHTSSQVRTGARLAVGLTTAGIYNPLEDLTLNLLHQDLSLPITEKATKTVTSQFAASLLALALAYPNSAREDLLPILLNAIQQGPLEVCENLKHSNKALNDMCLKLNDVSKSRICYRFSNK